jgi:hypothetical protein
LNRVNAKNAWTEKSRDDKTAIELFLAGVDAAICSLLIRAAI